MSTDLTALQAKLNAIKGNDQPKAKLAPQTGVASGAGVKTSDTKHDSLKKKEKSGYGGRREGSGRKQAQATIIAKGIKAWIDEHANEAVPMQLTDKKTGAVIIINKPRKFIAIEKLFEIGVKGDKVQGDAHAINMWLDRFMGKPAQPIRGEGEDDAPIQLQVNGLEAILRKAYGPDSTN